MKNIKYLALIPVMMGIITILCSFSQEENNNVFQVQIDKNEIDIEYLLLDNYFLKNTVKLTSDISVLTAQDTKTFNSYFGPAKTMTNKIVTPDFSKYSVIAIVGKASNIATTIAVNKITMDTQGIAVNVTIDRNGEQSFISTPTVLIMIPKQSTGIKITVVDGETRMSTGTL